MATALAASGLGRGPGGRADPAAREGRRKWSEDKMAAKVVRPSPPRRRPGSPRPSRGPRSRVPCLVGLWAGCAHWGWGAGAGAGTGPGALPGCPARGCAGRGRGGAGEPGRRPESSGCGARACALPLPPPRPRVAARRPGPHPYSSGVCGRKGRPAACFRGGEPGLSSLGAGGPVPFTWGFPGSLIFSDQLVTSGLPNHVLTVEPPDHGTRSQIQCLGISHLKSLMKESRYPVCAVTHSTL